MPPRGSRRSGASIREAGRSATASLYFSGTGVSYGSGTFAQPWTAALYAASVAYMPVWSLKLIAGSDSQAAEPHGRDRTEPPAGSSLGDECPWLGARRLIASPSASHARAYADNADVNSAKNIDTAAGHAVVLRGEGTRITGPTNREPQPAAPVAQTPVAGSR